MTENAGRYEFTGTTSVSATMLTADVDATGYFNNGNLHIDLDIAATLGNMNQVVKVTYDGTRLTGNESSAAQITSFTFDTSVAANAAVLSQPVIDEANATITFKAEEDGDVSALVPTIEVSADCYGNSGKRFYCKLYKWLGYIYCSSRRWYF